MGCSSTIIGMAVVLGSDEEANGVPSSIGKEAVVLGSDEINGITILDKQKEAEIRQQGKGQCR